MGTTTAQVMIGRVSTRKNARQHLDTAGRAHCGAGTGVIAAATRWAVDGSVATETVCRRCIKALRTALAAQPDTDTAAAGAALFLATPADAAREDAALLADLRTFQAGLAAQRAQFPQTEADRLGMTDWEYRHHVRARLAAGPIPAGFTRDDMIAEFGDLAA